MISEKVFEDKSNDLDAKQFALLVFVLAFQNNPTMALVSAREQMSYPWRDANGGNMVDRLSDIFANGPVGVRELEMRINANEVVVRMDDGRVYTYTGHKSTSKQHATFSIRWNKNQLAHLHSLCVTSDNVEIQNPYEAIKKN
jgi:hypothetical protein